MQKKPFFHQKPLEKRIQQFNKQMTKYPKFFHSIIQYTNDANEKVFKKLSIPPNVTVAQVKTQLDDLIKIPKHTRGTNLATKYQRRLLNPNMILQDIYNTCKSEDGWLYLTLEPFKPF